MKAGDHGQGLIRLDHEQERIRKTPQECAANVYVYNGELARPFGYLRYSYFDLGTKSTSQTRHLILIPILSFDKLESRSRTEAHEMH